MSITTSNMGLTIPIPSSTTGPLYAAQVGASLQLIADHDHSNSAKVTPAGLDITSDLTFQSNNANALRTTRYTDQVSTLGGINDINCQYFYLGDYYINNGSGVAVQITSGATLAGGSGGGSNAWECVAVAANRTIVPSDSYININVTTSSTITLSLPSAAAVAIGRYYIICDASGGSASNAMTLTPNGSDQINGVSSSRTLSSAYGTWIVRSDGVSKWQLVFTGHSGLTGTSLTYGTAVMSASGFTIGSNTLTASTLTIGSSTVTSSAVTTPTLVVAGNASFGGDISAVDADLSGNVTITGNLTVTGTVSFDADDIGISTINSGTIVNCAITGGTIDGATITGGNLGAADGIATLDSNGQLPDAQRGGWFVSASVGGASSLSLTNTSTTFNTPGAFGTALLYAVQGDVLIVSGTIYMTTPSATGAQWQLAVNDGGVDNAVAYSTQSIPPSATTMTWSQGGLIYTVANTGYVTLKTQMRSNNSSANVFLFANTVAVQLFRP